MLEMMSRFLTALSIVVVCLPEPCGPGCGPAEYEVQQECCPMCGAGYHVHKHCTEYTSTTCVPCPPSTYTDTPNGLVSCLSCSMCDSSAGLRRRKVCTYISNALCEPLEGYHCIDPIKDGCQGAKEHTKCSPGQYIKQPGTAYSDSVCDGCGEGTYSNGSFTSCEPHTQCPAGYEKVKEGTSSSDTECQKTGKGLIIAVSVSLLVLLLVAAVVVLFKKTSLGDKIRRRQEIVINETGDADPSQRPLQMVQQDPS